MFHYLLDFYRFASFVACTLCDFNKYSVLSTFSKLKSICTSLIDAQFDGHD